jgi:hypothetical protein
MSDRKADPERMKGSLVLRYQRGLVYASGRVIGAI